MCVCFCKSCSTMFNELCSLTMHSWFSSGTTSLVFTMQDALVYLWKLHQRFVFCCLFFKCYLSYIYYISVNVIFCWWNTTKMTTICDIDNRVIFIYAFLFFYSLDNHLDYSWVQHLLNCWTFCDEPLYSAALFDNMCRRGHKLIHSLSLILPRLLLLEERYRSLGDAGPKFVLIRSMDF